MPGFGFGFGFGFHRRASGGGASASETLLTLATAAGAEAVYDPDNEDTWTLRDDGSDLWYSAISDGLGNREDIVQSTAANQPKQKILSNGRRIITNDGSDKFMLADFASAISQPLTILLVGYYKDDTTGHRFIDSNSATGGRIIFGAGPDSGNVGAIWASSWIGTKVQEFTLAIWHGNYDGASSEVFLNGVSQQTGNSGTNGMGGIGILDFDAGAGAQLNGDLGPIIVFTSKKTNADLSDLRDHLNANWPIGTAT